MLDSVHPVEDRNLLMAEQMLIENDLNCPDFLCDNILYHVVGFLVRSLIGNMQCNNCKSHLLIDQTDKHALKMQVIHGMLALQHSSKVEFDFSFNTSN